MFALFGFRVHRVEYDYFFRDFVIIFGPEVLIPRARMGGQMRLTAVTAVVVLSLLAPLVASSESSSEDLSTSQDEFAPLKIGSPTPDFTEKDIYDKQIIALSGYRGEVVMLNFWATWCPPCRDEIPALEALQKVYKGRLVIIGASVYSTNANTELFYWEYKINYPMIYGSYDLMGKYGKVSSIPTTFLIDRDGKIAARVVGSRTKDEYEGMLRPLLSK